jgi:hypothetical protein
MLYESAPFVCGYAPGFARGAVHREQLLFGLCRGHGNPAFKHILQIAEIGIHLPP